MSIVAKAAGWIEMALGMELGLGPGHIVLDGASPATKIMAQPLSNFRPTSTAIKPLDGSRYQLVWR